MNILENPRTAAFIRFVRRTQPQSVSKAFEEELVHATKKGEKPRLAAILERLRKESPDAMVREKAVLRSVEQECGAMS